MNDFQEFIQKNYAETDYIARMYINNSRHGLNTYNYPANDFAMLPANQDNMYMGMNPVRWKNGSIRRDSEHVSRLKWLYVDIDCYKVGYTKEQVIMVLHDDYFKRIIPLPSYIVDSGRGLYLLWRIDEHVKALPRWKKVQKYFYEKLKEYGADGTCVTDIARVFRCPGSLNSKSETSVTILYDYNNYTYTLYEVMQEYMTSDRLQGCRVIPFLNSKGLLTSRINDLVSLLFFRNRADSMRENTFFLIRYWHLQLNGNKREALEYIKNINSQLKYPLTEKELERATRSAEKYYNKGILLRFSNARLIDFLQITKDEISVLKTIMSLKERKERKAARNKAAYLQHLKNAGKDTKQEQIREREQEIYKMMKEGKSSKEMSAIIGCSIRTVQNEVRKIKRMTADELARLERKVLPIYGKRAENFTNAKNSAFVLKDVVLCVSTSEERSDFIFDTVGFVSGAPPG